MHRVAAIDCGTNSIRLLVADFDERDHQLHDLVRTMEVVRLGQGVDKTKRLSAEALERTFAACDQMAQTIDELKPEAVKFVATSASRDAENSDVFVAGVKERLGVTPEVVSGEVEAEFSFSGAISSLGPVIESEGAWPALVIDLGGGSTECVLGTLEGGVQRAFSADVGCVRITERCLGGDPPSLEQVAQARDYINEQLDKAVEVVDLSSAQCVVGLAGTITTIAAIALDLDHYDPEAIHGYRLAISDIEEVTSDFLSKSSSQRLEIPVMHPGREDVIIGGALVLSELLKRTKVSSIFVSEHDILDGIAYSIIQDLSAN